MLEMHALDMTTAIASLGVKFIGLPSQARENHRDASRRQRAGMTTTIAGTMCLSYALWVAHGLAHGDWVEVLSQGAGAVITGFLFVQVLWCNRSARMGA